jgi:uncharacterized membrane protein YkvA (DUF1232 family)
VLIRLKSLAKKLKSQLFTLYFAYKNSKTPLFAKMFTCCVVAYAFSPIDLIPDFIPVLGYLDDLIIVPLGITIALKLIPESILEESRFKAQKKMSEQKPKNWFTGTVFILIWIALTVYVSRFLYIKFF